jgi:hypothetical protein
VGCGFCQTISDILVAADKRKLTYFLTPPGLLELRKIDTQACYLGGVLRELQQLVQVIPKRKCLVKSVGQGNGFTIKNYSHDERGLARAERHNVTKRSFVLQCNDVTEL